MSWEHSEIFEEKFKRVPLQLRKIIYEIRDRINDIKKRYGSMGAYGLPIINSKEEASVLWYVNNVYDVPYYTLANWMGIKPVTLWRLFKSIKENGYVTINVEGKRVRVELTPEEAKTIVEEMLKPKEKRNIPSVMESRVVQEFLKNPVRRAGSAKYGRMLPEKVVRSTINIIQRIADYIREYHHELPTNPDLWNEDMIARVLEEMKKEYGWSDQYMRSIKIALRRVFPTWFTHQVGSAKSVAKPKETYIPYDMFLRVLASPEFSGVEKLYLKLHVTTGAREGIGASEPSSMWGLRWDKINWRDKIIKIWESKTKKEWRGRLDLFFNELPDELYQLWVKLGRPEGYIWKTLGFTKNKFNTMIHDVLRRISKMFSDELKERFGTDRLVPHDLRRTHVVWLIDAGVDLESIAKSDEFDLGVGWENLDTLLVYYARFTARRRAIELAKVYLRYQHDVPEDIVRMSGMSKEELIKVVKAVS